mgnify:CR=1 FL=1
MPSKLETFRKQIAEDIDMLKESMKDEDPKIETNDGYAFNYWVLNKIFSLDEHMIKDQITDYNDGAIDCFVSFPENKELYIIQNKYYADGTPVVRAHFTDFLTNPLVQLVAGNYTRSRDLQQLFSSAMEDDEYKVFFHFYTTSDNFPDNVKALFSHFNMQKTTGAKCMFQSSLIQLEDMYNLYFGKNYQEDKSFSYTLQTYNKGALAGLKSEYLLDVPYEGYYIVTPIVELYEMLKKAEKESYPLFESNIREYLGGKSAVNKKIIETLKDRNERANFIYYNNGVTILCKKSIVPRTVQGNCQLKFDNPQIVNGCQTVNSIQSVLDDYRETPDWENDFANVFIMVKDRKSVV